MDTFVEILAALASLIIWGTIFLYLRGPIKRAYRSVIDSVHEHGVEQVDIRQIKGEKDDD